MNLTKAAATALGGVGVVAAANRVLARSAGELEPPLPGGTGTYRWRGLDVAYTETGDPEDPDLLLLHGINAAGTSKEFEPIVETLADSYHVIAPDLPGFGRSERPPLLYSGALYRSFVADVARDLTEDAVCVASSLTAAYAAGAADDAGFSRLVLVCPTDATMPGRRLWLRTLFRAPLVGTALFNAIASKPSIRYFGSDHGYYDVGNKPADLAAYQWESAHQPGARFAPASFISGFLDPDPDFDLTETLRRLDIPTTLVWGREADITPLSEGRELADAVDARLVVVDYAKLQPHSEHPMEFLDAIASDLGLDVATV